jgi:uncharacterized oligopeptide transporter (OPT) family protein
MRTETTPSPAPPALTLRAAVAGALVGLPLAVGNLYMGLKTGWWDSGSITASIVGFALLGALSRPGGRAGPLETTAAMSLAAAMGAAPAAAGLLGALPALALLGRPVPAWAAAGWGMALGALGVLLALWLRRRLIEEEGLPFPTGLATAEVIAALHAGGAGGRGRALLGGAGVAAAVAWLRGGRPLARPRGRRTGRGPRPGARRLAHDGGGRTPGGPAERALGPAGRGAGLGPAGP